MARNKYPEETVNRILDTAMRLFMEKGYEHTTIQDIVDQLDVTKGAVYHHFKSKEDILNAAIDRESEPLMRLLVQIRDDPRMTGLEKMQALFEASMDGPQLPLSAEVAIAPDPVRNSRFLGDPGVAQQPPKKLIDFSILRQSRLTSPEVSVIVLPDERRSHRRHVRRRRHNQHDHLAHG